MEKNIAPKHSLQTLGGYVPVALVENPSSGYRSVDTSLTCSAGSSEGKTPQILNQTCLV